MELIDREALLDECLNHYEVGNIEQNCTMDWICKTVRNFPAASPWHRVEHGKFKGLPWLINTLESVTEDGTWKMMEQYIPIGCLYQSRRRRTHENRDYP